MRIGYTIVSNGMGNARWTEGMLGVLKVSPLAVCVGNLSNPQLAFCLHTPTWSCRDAEIVVGRCGRDTRLEEVLARGKDGIFQGRTGIADCEEDVY